MKRRKKLIIAILVVVLIGLLLVIYGALFSGPDLTNESKNVLVLASDKYEQSNGGVDMAFMVHLENGSLKNYTPVYPGGMVHPSQPAPGGLGGNMYLHDCLWDGVDVGSEYAKEIVEANTGMHSDAVVIVYDEGLDHIINSIRPLYVDGVETELNRFFELVQILHQLNFVCKLTYLLALNLIRDLSEIFVAHVLVFPELSGGGVAD